MRIAVQLGHVAWSHDLAERNERFVVGPLVRIAPGCLVGLHAGDDHMTLASELQLVNGAQASIGLEVIKLLQAIAFGRKTEAGVIRQ